MSSSPAGSPAHRDQPGSCSDLGVAPRPSFGEAPFAMLDVVLVFGAPRPSFPVRTFVLVFPGLRRFVVAEFIEVRSSSLSGGKSKRCSQRKNERSEKRTGVWARAEV